MILTAWTCALTLATVFLTAQLTASLRQADRHAYLYGYPKPNDRALFCLMSAACLKETKIFLALFDSNHRPQRFEDAALANDCGQALLADAAAILLPRPVTLTTLVKINYLINAAGVGALAFMLGGVGMAWAAVLCLFFGVYYLIPGPVPSADLSAMFGGILCFALVPAVWLAGSQWFSKKRLHLIAGGIFSWLCLAGAVLLRQPLGLIGVGCALIFLMGRMWTDSPKGRQTLVLFTAGAAAILSTLFVTPVLFGLRNALYHFPPSPYVHSHGLWHTLYLGLGVVPNPWGIHWNDFEAFDQFKRVNPGINVCTPAYFEAMKRAYLGLAFRYPRELFSIYGVKLGQALFAPLKLLGLNVFVWAGIALAVVPWTLWKVSSRHAMPLRMMMVFALALVGMLLQGVLAIPHRMYLYPSQFLGAAMLLCLLDLMEQPFPKPF